MDENDTSGMLNDSSILNTSVNFNVGNLKEMLKCISCHRFLFPPILQCAQGHMTCKSCFEIKGIKYSLVIFYIFYPFLWCYEIWKINFNLINDFIHELIISNIQVKCEKCHSKMLEVPAKFAEMITEQFKVQCIYAEKGCKEAIPFKVRKVWTSEHREIKRYMKI